jgi:tetratricopeptide (TPR) repeat protein
VHLVEQDEIVGYHLEQAVLYRRELGDRDDDVLAARAARRLSAAGQGALRRADKYAAARLLERAATLLPSGAIERLELVPDLALALVDVGRIHDAYAYVDELSAGDERWESYASTIRPILDTMGGTGSFETGREKFAAAEDTFRRLGDDRGLALALMVQGHDLWTSCRAAAAAEKYHAALPHAERAGRSDLVADVVGVLCSIAVVGPTHVDAAEEEIRDLLARATSVVVESKATTGLSRLAAIRGDFDAARDSMRRGRDQLLDAGLLLMHAASSMHAASIEERAGDDESAQAFYREGFDQLSQLGEHAYASTIAADLARTLLRLGREEEAETWLETARELCPPGDVGTLVSADMGEALVRSLQGEHESAERLARKALELAQTTDFWDQRGEAYEALAKVLAASGRTTEARAALESAVEIYEEKGAEVPEKRARALLGEL